MTAPAITAYIDRRRSLGFKCDNEARILHELDAFLAGQGRSELTSEGMHDWALTLEPLKLQGRLKKMRIVSRFTLHRRRAAAECFMPDPARFPTPSPAPAPWILTERQVPALLEQAGQFQSPPHSPLRPRADRLALVVLHTAGLRPGNLLRRCIGDYDPSRHTLLARVSKFHKTHLVALSGDAWRELDSYLQLRQCFPHTVESAPHPCKPRIQPAAAGSPPAATRSPACRSD